MAVASKAASGAKHGFGNDARGYTSCIPVGQSNQK
jgi:hypothetical protein